MKSPQPLKRLQANQNFLGKTEKVNKADPTQLMSILAKRHNVSHRTISRAVNEDLGMRSYVRRCRNLFTACLTATKVERCPKVLNHLKNKGGHIGVFVDKKKFILNKVANCQNTQVIACDPSEAPPVMQSQNPASCDPASHLVMMSAAMVIAR